MVNFLPIDYKVYIIWMFLAITADASIRIPQELLRQYVKEFVQPYVESLENVPIFRDTMQRKFSAISLTSFINHTVEKLKPFLEDDLLEESLFPEDTQIDLKDEDKATIIEFTKKRSLRHKNVTEALEENAKRFKVNIAKYQKLRNKIKKALKRDHVTNKTRTLVLKTLEKMIDQMLAHKCPWKGSSAFDVQFRSMLSNSTNPLSPEALVNTWHHVWNKLKKQYHEKRAAHRKRDNHDFEKKDSFLDKFEELMSVMTSDLNTMINKHKVVCHFEGVDAPELRHKDDPETKSRDTELSDINNETITKVADADYKSDDPQCSKFKICSEELKTFLNDFYNQLNESAVTVITNYAAMFIRDVNEDSHHEKDRVIGLINKTAEEVEERIGEEFKEQTKNIILDPKRNKQANMQILRKYITTTTDEVEKIVIEEIKTGLFSVKEKLKLTILEDIKVNMQIDMTNVERVWINNVCENFVLCNGRDTAARKSAFPRITKNNIYVKLKLDFDDEDVVKTTTKHRKTIYRNFRVIVTKSPFRINVTRTAPTMNRVYINLKPQFESNAAKFVAQYARRRNDDDKDPKQVNVTVIVKEKEP